MDEKTIARFWSKVDRAAGTGRCWPYMGGRDRNGYGRFCADGGTRLAHRVAFALAVSPPGRLHVCHRCDNPPCCNPAHLFTGTMRDNMRDKVAKGRQSRGPKHAVAVRESAKCGDAHHHTRLSDGEAEEVLRLYKGRGSGPTQQELADRFGVSRGTISDLIRGKRRGHERRHQDQRYALTEAQVDEVRSLYRGPRTKPTQAELAQRFGVTQAQISLIILGKSRAHGIGRTHNPGGKRPDRRSS